MQTSGGGAFGWGTAFKLSPNATDVVLHDFNIGVDGWLPVGGLVADAAGDLYGVTTYTSPLSVAQGAPESPLARDEAGNL